MSEGVASNCPRCGKPGRDFRPLDTGMKLALQTAGEMVATDIICNNCHDELSRKVSKGVQLRAEEKAKEQNRVVMWKSRVNQVKQARQMMEQKAFSEAAVCYEKYLRVLEIVHDLKAGELNPEIFNNSTRSKELTVITSVYWDLMRIYDTSPRYGERMQKATRKLAVFLPYSSIFPDILRKAEIFQKSAKNPDVVRGFLKMVRKGKGRCFIATSAFGGPMVPEVRVLRQFRDQFLKAHPIGRSGVRFYYQHSPKIADWLDRHSYIKPLVRAGLRAFVWGLKRIGLKSSPLS